MALFWLLAGMMISLAGVILILPWLRRIPRLGPLPAVPWPLSVAAVLVLVAVLGLYHWLGRPDLAAGAASTVAQPAAATPANKAAAGSMASAIASLQARLAKGGGSNDDWELLAKSYEFLGQPEQAAKARAHQLPDLPLQQDLQGPLLTAPPSAPAAIQLTPDTLQWLAKADKARRAKHPKDAMAIYAQLAARGQMNADSWADYADTAATLAGNKLAGEPERFVDKALALDPGHAKALWLKASADEEAGRYADAVVAWKKLQDVLPPDSSDAKVVSASIAQDLQRSAGTVSAQAPAGGGSQVSGEIALAPGLAGKAAAGATLFVVAKSVDSPGMPVAVYRTSVGAWPARFVLSDAQAMMPGRTLSNAGRITVEARVSRTGDAMPATGDLLGSAGMVNPADHKDIRILIDKVVP